MVFLWGWGDDGRPRTTAVVRLHPWSHSLRASRSVAAPQRRGFVDKDRPYTHHRNLEKSGAIDPQAAAGFFLSRKDAELEAEPGWRARARGAQVRLGSVRGRVPGRRGYLRTNSRPRQASAPREHTQRTAEAGAGRVRPHTYSLTCV